MEDRKGKSILYDDLVCVEKSLPMCALFFSIRVDELEEVLQLCSGYNSPLYSENCPEFFGIARHRVSYLN